MTVVLLLLFFSLCAQTKSSWGLSDDDQEEIYEDIERGNDDCRPFSDCWCELHPNNPHCSPKASIDGVYWLIFLAAAGIVIIKRRMI